jgi:hypothetical protein
VGKVVEAGEQDKGGVVEGKVIGEVEGDEEDKDPEPLLMKEESLLPLLPT